MVITTLINDATAVASSSQATVAVEGSQELLTSAFRQTYHELSERHVAESDVLVQLKANLAQLEDLHLRLQFMMSEISYLLKKS